MRYRRLGKTDIRMSVIGIGTWQFGGEWGKTFEQAEVDAMLERAAELGVNLIDTAGCYGDHLSEKLIGQAVKGQREKWIIATKFGHRFKPNFERDSLFEPAQVQEQLEQSLRSLKTDYIDLYQFHSGTDEMFNTPGLWEILQKQVQAGKVRHLGISISRKQGSTYQVNKSSAVGSKQSRSYITGSSESRRNRFLTPAFSRTWACWQGFLWRVDFSAVNTAKIRSLPVAMFGASGRMMK